MSDPMRMRLSREAHVWLSSRIDDQTGDRLGPLSAAERRRVERLRHPVARRHFLEGRFLLRHALSQYAPIDPAEWIIEETELGRPEVAGPDQARGLRFNLSHSGDFVACIVTETLDCGIDLESLDRSIDAIRIAQHSFHPDEVERLAQLEDSAQRELFFSLWTLKEAYLKARGSGIRLRLDSAWFDLVSGNAIFAQFRDPGEESSGWRFALCEPASGHVAATAVRAGSEERRIVTLTLDKEGSPRPWPARFLAVG